MSGLLFDDSQASWATFSPDRAFRYVLGRMWAPNSPWLLFVMLNPSTADETVNDNTIKGCIKRARAMGMGGVRVVNLFALRSTDPKALYSEPDPIGPENNDHIKDEAIEAHLQGGMVICAWGKHGMFRFRHAEVIEMLAKRGIPLHVLAINKDGTPKHPLYVADVVRPFPLNVDQPAEAKAA